MHKAYRYPKDFISNKKAKELLGSKTEEFTGDILAVDYGRPDEGYQGPLVHLRFNPVTRISIVQGPVFGHLRSSLDALYFLNDGEVNDMLVPENTFVLMKGAYKLKTNKVIISRFGDNERIQNQQDFYLDDCVGSCQWAIMNFKEGSTLANHLHKHKTEIFYFNEPVDMTVDGLTSRVEGYTVVPKGVQHSMQSNYRDVTFHSLNIPDILNDSRRL